MVGFSLGQGVPLHRGLHQLGVSTNFNKMLYPPETHHETTMIFLIFFAFPCFIATQIEGEKISSTQFILYYRNFYVQKISTMGLTYYCPIIWTWSSCPMFWTLGKKHICPIDLTWSSCPMFWTLGKKHVCPIVLTYVNCRPFPAILTNNAAVKEMAQYLYNHCFILHTNLQQKQTCHC